MSSSSISKIKNGLLIGVGLLLPITAGVWAGNMLVNYVSSSESYESDDYSGYSELTTDYAELISVEKFTDKSKDGKVNILGTITNKGEVSVGSIKLEAEFFNNEGEFVQEQSTYISKKLAPNESENFQITCTCKGQSLPEYTKITVRTVSAHSF
ncbi:FxLYD domain-containing protein [Pseudomonas sp. EA_35y_Pfl2_R5]|uniref:FxLYD domain-containing protein n=1 Tax=Pseudomonas sp. EA_35y_Pfl2_R5 TaxID=3088690 RepID=UPI0030DBC821